MEITANQSLDLTGAIINAGNYLNLSSTNHYAGSQGAQVTFPFADISLGSTNGQMSISNLVAPYLTRWNGRLPAVPAGDPGLERHLDQRDNLRHQRCRYQFFSDH